MCYETSKIRISKSQKFPCDDAPLETGSYVRKHKEEAKKGFHRITSVLLTSSWETFVGHRSTLSTVSLLNSRPKSLKNFFPLKLGSFARHLKIKAVIKSCFNDHSEGGSWRHFGFNYRETKQ
jgi:hypothetical protein